MEIIENLGAVKNFVFAVLGGAQDPPLRILRERHRKTVNRRIVGSFSSEQTKAAFLAALLSLEGECSQRPEAGFSGISALVIGAWGSPPTRLDFPIGNAYRYSNIY